MVKKIRAWWNHRLAARRDTFEISNEKVNRLTHCWKGVFKLIIMLKIALFFHEYWGKYEIQFKWNHGIATLEMQQNSGTSVFWKALAALIFQTRKCILWRISVRTTGNFTNIYRQMKSTWTNCLGLEIQNMTFYRAKLVKSSYKKTTAILKYNLM